MWQAWERAEQDILRVLIRRYFHILHWEVVQAVDQVIRGDLAVGAEYLEFREAWGCNPH